MEKIFPAEAKLDGEKTVAGVTLSIAESLRNGIVSNRDMYFFAEESLEAYARAGMKVNFGRAIVSDGDTPLEDLKYFIEAKSLYENHNDSHGEKIKVDFSLHAEYTCNDKTVREFADFVSDKDLRLHIHMAETEKETTECKERHGVSPVEYFASRGLLTDKTLVAHAVHISDSDISAIAKSGATVATCPVSNLKLGSGVCRVSDLYKANANVTIGTDGPASNNSLSMLSEMKLALILQRGIFRDFETVTPERVLRSASRNAFRSQGREDCGLIKEGCRADLVVFDLTAPNLNPNFNAANNLIFSANESNIFMTMVDGKVLYKGGEWLTIDMEKAIWEASKAAKAISTSS
jgi:5-methylthioadenosine/S-adenosylhomocysteine deaminase